MIEIKRGRELDRVVAEAIDYHCHVVVGYEEGPDKDDLAARMSLLYYQKSIIEWLRFDDSRFPANCLPQFSVDLNAAFAAAAEVFSAFRLRYRGKERWEFECEFPGNDGWGYCGEYSTGALAICAGVSILGRMKSEEAGKNP